MINPNLNSRNVMGENTKESKRVCSHVPDYFISTSPSGSQVTTENLDHYFLDREGGLVTLTSVTWYYSHTVQATKDLVLDVDACLTVLEPQVQEMWEGYANASQGRSLDNETQGNKKT